MENLRVYWLDVINENYDYNVFYNDDMFITEAEKCGNVATQSDFIKVVVNSDEFNSQDCLVKLLPFK